MPNIQKPFPTTWPITDDERKQRALLVEQKIKVRSYDIDSAGHVSNIVYLRWMEDLRWLLCDTHFPLQPFVESGITPIIASTNIEYKRPVKLFDEPIGQMWIGDVGHASMRFEGAIYVNDRLATKSIHFGAFVDLKTMKPVKVPSVVKEKFLAFRLEEKG